MTLKIFDPNVPIAVIGMGVMGAKVAWACARAGIPTHAFDVSPETLEKSVALVKTWSDGEELSTLTTNLKICQRLEDAIKGVQLAFENVPEDLALKQRILADLGRRLDPEAYMGSNTSALRCSPLAEASGRSERFFNMNWSDPRFSVSLELMGNPATAPETITFAKAWAAHMGMVPLYVKVEQMGYSFNRLWRVIKKEVLRQIAEGIVEPEEIDRVWMQSFGTSFGPCGLMDIVGLPSVKKIEMAYYLDSGDESDKPPALLDEMIAQGKTGETAGEGFYKYPDPAYKNPEWLKGG